MRRRTSRSLSRASRSIEHSLPDGCLGKRDRCPAFAASDRAGATWARSPTSRLACSSTDESGAVLSRFRTWAATATPGACAGKGGWVIAEDEEGKQLVPVWSHHASQ